MAHSHTHKNLEDAENSKEREAIRLDQHSEGGERCAKLLSGVLFVLSLYMP